MVADPKTPPLFAPLTIEAAVAYRETIVSATGPRTIARPRAFPPAAWLILLIALLVRPAGAVCPGDCNGDGNVTVNEIIQAVSIALGQASAATCRAIDRDADGSVSISELLAAVNALLGGCPPEPTVTAVQSTPTQAQATPTATPTSSETPQPTATDTPNEPPVLPTASIYRTYPGFDVRLPIGATDPGGGAVQCMASDLPAGASLGADNVLSWTPAPEQLGPFYVPFSCSDTAEPPATADGTLTFKVMPTDSCAMPSCDPASGCTSTLPPVTQTCCAAGPVERVAEPVAGCPEGRVVFIGQNRVTQKPEDQTFGRLQNCDIMTMRNFQQSGAEISFHVEARCLNTLNRVRIGARMESNAQFHTVLFDAETNKFLDDGPDGFVSQFGLQFGINGPGPFFDLEGAEANLTVTLTDSDNVSTATSVRVRLSFTPRADLPDVDPTPSPTPAL